MDLSGVIQKMSDQLRSCVDRYDFENAQLLNKAIENVLAIKNEPNSASKGDAESKVKRRRNSPADNDNKGGHKATQQGVTPVPVSSTTASTSATSTSHTTGTSNFVSTADDSQTTQVELLLWHKGTNCCLNTMTPIQVPALTPDNGNDVDGIWILPPAPKNPTLIFSVNVSSEGILTTDELSRVISSARKSAGPNRALSIQILDWGKIPWSRNNKMLQDWFAALGVNVTVLSLPPTDPCTPFFSVHSRRCWACHHSMAVFIVANLSLIFPTWVVHKHFDQWSDRLATKAKNVLRRFLPAGYFSTSYVVTWFRGEFMSWCSLLSKPDLITLSPDEVCNYPEIEENFRANKALLLNGTVRLVFVLDRVLCIKNLFFKI